MKDFALAVGFVLTMMFASVAPASVEVNAQYVWCAAQFKYRGQTTSFNQLTNNQQRFESELWNRKVNGVVRFMKKSKNMKDKTDCSGILAKVQQ